MCRHHHVTCPQPWEPSLHPASGSVAPHRSPHPLGSLSETSLFPAPVHTPWVRPFFPPAVLLGQPPTPLLPSVHFTHCWQNKKALFTHFLCGSPQCRWSKQTPEHGIQGAACSAPILSCQSCHSSHIRSPFSTPASQSEYTA